MICPKVPLCKTSFRRVFDLFLNFDVNASWFAKFLFVIAMVVFFNDVHSVNVVTVTTFALLKMFPHFSFFFCIDRKLRIDCF